MAKINFKKVEESLTAGLAKMKVDQLGDIADASQAIGRPELRSLADRILLAAAQKAMERKSAFFILTHGASKHREDDFYAEFKISYSDFKEMLKKGKQLTAEDWEILIPIKKKMQDVKAEELKANPELDNENLVKQNRKKQKTARMNVQKTWLPLT